MPCDVEGERFGGHLDFLKLDCDWFEGGLSDLEDGGTLSGVC